MTGYADLPDTQLVKRLNAIESQLRALSTSPRAGHTAIVKGTLDIIDGDGHKVGAYGIQDDGSVALQIFNAAGVPVGIFGKQADGTIALRILDAAGVTRVVLGQLSGGGFGAVLSDAEGNPTFQVTEGGIDSPAIPLPYRAFQSSSPVTSATYVGQWLFGFGKITHDSIKVTVPMSTDPSTIGSVRLRVAKDGTDLFTSAAQTVPANSAAHYTWAWQPGWTVGDEGRYAVVVDVLRNSGAGNVYAGEPDLAYLARGTTIGATSTGV